MVPRETAERWKAWQDKSRRQGYCRDGWTAWEVAESEEEDGRKFGIHGKIIKERQVAQSREGERKLIMTLTLMKT